MQDLPRVGPVLTLARNMLAFVTHSERAAAYPSIVKIDISPQCSLACTHCLHANPEGREKPLLGAQSFAKDDRMTLDQFASIIAQLDGKAMAVSLYYYGDPLIHPQIDSMIAIARRAGLGVHITTHFSYNFTKERIRKLVESGLSHLTVAVDGATQESYAMTRVRGRLEHVLANLAMVSVLKRELGRRHPYVEVQHLRFPHHPPGELERVRQLADDLGADKFTTYRGIHRTEKGDLYNVVDDGPEQDARGAPPTTGSVLPHCLWPYSSTVIRFDGAVIPCCLWRVGTQYAPGHDSYALGNIFEAPLAEIWNGGAYRRLRRQASNPAKEAGTTGRTGSFCDGCPRLCSHEAAAEPPMIAATSPGDQLFQAQ